MPADLKIKKGCEFSLVAFSIKLRTNYFKCFRRNDTILYPS